MITATSPRDHSALAVPAGEERWQAELARAIADPFELLQRLDLDASELPPGLAPSREAAARFRVRVPEGFLARMRRGDPADPLLRQVLACGEELTDTPGFGADPLEEAAARRAPGLLQKYPGRALLVVTSACAVHCRYCFRREFPYASDHDDSGRWRQALAVIAQDESIEEIILSGGDPLSLADSRLAVLTSRLARIPHVKRLRIHTRQPIVLPSRVTHGLVAWLRALPWPTALVLHANHANEIDGEVQAALARLRESGALLLNQSVLLRGVNDDCGALAQLSRRLFAAGVLPYYLHLLDRVRGAAHFEVDSARAALLVGQLTARLPGYLVPRLVRETPHAAAKVPVPAALAPLFEDPGIAV